MLLGCTCYSINATAFTLGTDVYVYIASHANILAEFYSANTYYTAMQNGYLKHLNMPILYIILSDLSWIMADLV